MSDPACYHCGLPIPDEVDFPVQITGETRQMCCLGCQAVAQAIVDNGLADYYRTRDSLPESPREAVPAVLDQLALFDHAEFQKGFVRALGDNEREASLILEGITCAACVWLNEQHVSRLPGVLAVDINYATRRARVRWDESKLRLSEILAAIAAIGYRAYPYDAARTEELAQKERRDAMWRVWVAGFGMMQVMMYAFPVYIAGEGEMSLDIESLMRWASLLLTLPVVFYSSAPFFRHAWRDLKLRRVGMDVPVALGIGAAFVASIWATLTQSGEVYYDSVTMFVFFLLGGRYLEMTARQKAVSATEALAKLQPSFAHRVADYPTQKAGTQVAISELAVGETILVKPGEVIPVDGVIVEGESHADEALLTGESLPVRKSIGDEVTGGTLNRESPLYVRIAALGEATRLSAIVRLMERAATEKPKIVEFADRIAGRFVAVLLVIALLVGVAWYYVDPSKALWITVSVLVVTCPCALSLATPIALTVAAGALAKQGLLVTRGHAIETLARATHFVFDKTGTLTSGQMRLQEVVPIADLSKNDCLSLAAALEQGSEHPIALAILRGFSAAAGNTESSAVLPAVTRSVAKTGAGIEGEISGTPYFLGRLDYVQTAAGITENQLARFADDDLTVVGLATANQLLAVFRLGDQIRPEAPDLVRYLQTHGREVVLLSGDSPSAVRHIARQLQLGDAGFIAGATPHDKHEYVQQLQAQGAVVAMIGDGVNDAPVLAQAQVSIAMGSGAQLARAQADLVLLSENLQHLEQGIAKSVLCFRIIRQNLWWSFIYNLVALPLAIAGYVTPWLAGIGMSASSLLVVLNSLRLQR